MGKASQSAKTPNLHTTNATSENNLLYMYYLYIQILGFQCPVYECSLAK